MRGRNAGLLPYSSLLINSLSLPVCIMPGSTSPGFIMTGATISTLENLLVYRQALSTREGLLPPEQQAVQQLGVIPSPKQSEKDTGGDPEDTLSYWFPPGIHEADRFLSPFQQAAGGGGGLPGSVVQIAVRIRLAIERRSR